ncbi:MAG: hypothetical protein JNN08_14475 [Bryobacterales bacterium]|nr:hypothetical protein [Bryobacterales bacterium]
MSVATPVSLESRAAENLRYIRETIERANTFTAVPGWGGFWMGVTSIGAGVLADRQAEFTGWLQVWLAEACIALLIGIVALTHKARATGQGLWSKPARKFALAFAPPVVAAGLFTIALWRAGAHALIAGAWLSLYGVAVMGAGVFSVSVVPAMGVCFLALGCIALLAPSLGNVALICGFGVLHVVFGLIIARRHGG